MKKTTHIKVGDENDEYNVGVKITIETTTNKRREGMTLKAKLDMEHGRMVDEVLKRLSDEGRDFIQDMKIATVK